MTITVRWEWRGLKHMYCPLLLWAVSKICLFRIHYYKLAWIFTQTLERTLHIVHLCNCLYANKHRETQSLSWSRTGENVRVSTAKEIPYSDMFIYVWNLPPRNFLCLSAKTGVGNGKKGVCLVRASSRSISYVARAFRFLRLSANKTRILARICIARTQIRISANIKTTNSPRKK